MNKLFRLFWEFFKISLFVIGGGYSIIVVADEVFARLKWTEEGEVFDKLPVFQIVPGLIATHTAVYVGRKTAGPLGALVAVFAVALPSIVIFTFIAAGYGSLPLGNPYLEHTFTGLRAALTGIIAAAVIKSWKKSLPSVRAYFGLILGIAALVLGVPVYLVIILAVLLALVAETSGHRLYSIAPLFLFLEYGSLCFGGGFVIVPMYLQDFVGATAPYLQLTLEEFSNVMAISQMTPGPIGVNAATFFGYRLGGVGGAIAASALLLLPGSLMAYALLTSLDRGKNNRFVIGVLKSVKPVAMALMLFALAAFAKMTFTGIVPVILTIIVTVIIMKKKLNVIAVIWLAAAAGLCSTTFAANYEDVTTRRFPDADSVVVEETEKVKYNPDGTYEDLQESYVKILTEKGRREESVFSLGYSRRYGIGEITYVGAIGADGQEREIDVSATLKEATDNSSMSSNIYDPMHRRLTCTIPSLKIGEILHIKTRVKAEKPRCEGHWSDQCLMEWTHPILKSTYEVIAPKDLPLKKIAIRHPLGNITTNLIANADGTTTYLFCATNSAQVFPEPDMPPLFTQLQSVRVSTTETWPEISQWYWDLCAPHLAKTNAALVAKAKELATLRAIFKFVSQEIRYMGLTMEDTSPGYAPHDVNLTFDNRYGVCRDKAGLLVAMLRTAGYKAFPVLIHVGAKLDREIPQAYFNHAIVAVESEGETAERKVGKYILMDPTDENTKDLFPSYLCNCSYLVCRPEGEELMLSPVPDPKAHTLSINARGKLSEDKSLCMDYELAFGGINDNAYRGGMVRMKKEDRAKFFERVVKRCSEGAELYRVEIEPEDMRNTEKPVKVRLGVKFPEMLISGDTREELTLPFLSRIVGVANFLLDDNTALVQRKFALELSTTARVEEELALDLGEREAASLPEAVKIEGDYGYKLEYAVTNGTLKVRRENTLAAVEFEPERYSQLREQLKERESAERKRVMFTKDPLAQADVHYLVDVSETTVISDREWVKTNRVVKKVLTYKGKQNSAELSFAFNPLCGKVEVLEACVSNLNGQVYSASEKEMNVMDAGWVSAAPRYPASKKLIVNLPSVEIGSVISYTTVTTITNAPTPFYASCTFDSHEPVERQVFRVNDFRREVVRPKRLANEPSQPSAFFWRDMETISYAKFQPVDLKIDASDDLPTVGEDMKAIRDWMAKYVKVRGPSLYEVPLENQLTPIATVLKERYATRLDYIRTLTALLRRAGYEAEVVYAAGNATQPDEIRRRDMYEKPNPRIFSTPLCRVTVREGGFLGLGETVKEYFVGNENEYAELGASAYENSDYFAPERGEFGLVTVPEKRLTKDYEERCLYIVREDGDVDLEVERIFRGSTVGAFRKKYAEMLPELRYRRYQELLGDISQAATATGELVTDTEGYPATMAFKCYVPNMAMATKDTLTLKLPGFASSLPTIVGTARSTPFALSSAEAEREVVRVRFPKGYTRVEHLPGEFKFFNPLDQTEPWLEQRVVKRTLEDQLEVEITRTVYSRRYSYYGPEYFELLQDWVRIAASKANRTLILRRRVQN